MSSLTHPEDEESLEGVVGHVGLERVGVVAGHAPEAPHEGHEEVQRDKDSGRRCHLTNVHRWVFFKGMERTQVFTIRTEKALFKLCLLNDIRQITCLHATGCIW